MKRVFALAGVLCGAFLSLPVFAEAGDAAAPPTSGSGAQFFLQILLVFGLIFLSLLATKKIAAWIDRNREKRKK